MSAASRSSTDREVLAAHLTATIPLQVGVGATFARARAGSPWLAGDAVAFALTGTVFLLALAGVAFSAPLLLWVAGGATTSQVGYYLLLRRRHCFPCPAPVSVLYSFARTAHAVVTLHGDEQQVAHANETILAFEEAASAYTSVLSLRRGVRVMDPARLREVGRELTALTRSMVDLATDLGVAAYEHQESHGALARERAGQVLSRSRQVRRDAAATPRP